MTEVTKTHVVVLGGGPGGYSAAFRAADLGKEVVLIDQNNTLGGVCLNVGCIPSKTLLHVAKVIDEASEMAKHGINFGKPKMDTKKILEFKQQVVDKLTGGLAVLAKQRKVKVIKGYGKFKSKNEVVIDNKTTVQFEQAIIAAGSRPVKLPFIPEDSRIMDSTGALELENPDSHLLIIGGGIIGLEMGTVYKALGAEVIVVEFMPQIIPGADKDIVTPLQKRMEKKGFKFMLETKVTKVEPKKDGVYVTFEGNKAPAQPQKFDQILVAVGRTPNGKLIDAEKAGINVDERGFIKVDKQLRTNVANIFAIGDIIGNPMLAHKAVHEGHVAAEVVAGEKHFFDPRCIPAVAYTDPEIAWVGLTEKEAKEKGIEYGKGVFPWMASGRSLSQGRDEGVTKLLFDKKTNRVIGGAMVGPNAGELVAEVGLAIEMGAEAEDIALTIHPHPSLSESVGLASEIFTGHITDLIAPKKKD
ncbi:MAG: dihydrolipoyl dehydrogenase [Gammaproteobacteria bacterium RIFCSPHIGHO2_12_FULL_35_23]|nr:MAG: dihydrolipoyl dehydrogenase [Gammaproteobacteria bacterium RIFCSPHIGHO2_12_FULL_35_23]